MHYFFSRRTYDYSNYQFTDNFAAKTRYVGVTSGPNTQFTRYQYSATEWAKHVMAQSTNGDVLIFVHGYNNTQNVAVDRMLKIKKGLTAQNFDGAVIAYDWPATTSYRGSRTNADRSSAFLISEGINVLLAERPDAKIHIMAHSMGSLVTLLGFAQVGDPPAPLSLSGGIEQVMFVAGDILQASLAKGTGGALVMAKRSKRLTNYNSIYDEVLDASGKNPGSYGLRAGQHGLRYHPPNTFADVSCADRYHTFIPIPRDRDWRKSHNWHFDDSRFYSDAAYVLSGMANADMPTRQPHSFGDQRLLP